MGPTNTGRAISQEAFDEVVKENMEDLGMEPAEALQDAIQTLTLQGVDLSGPLLTFRIVKCVPGESSVKDNPVIQSLERLKQLDINSKDRITDEDLNEMRELFDKLLELCGCNNEVSGNVPIATRNGAVELVCAICSKIPAGSKRVLLSCLKIMALFIHGKWFSRIVNSVSFVWLVYDS
ncbi:hypothetical protein Pint_34469 [Pistacia integerrima]|uniref:Uncharacterized protein n=1 Tax=Pistacia integerrima TaxID=434235 RepID=A0ACC0X3M0_9ROSI|nr:hypothetical protein Pint_34469 [Pistacia integerrima]